MRIHSIICATFLWLGPMAACASDLAFNCSDVEATLEKLKSEPIIWREMRNRIHRLESAVEDRKHSLIDFSLKAIEVSEEWNPSSVPKENTDYCSLVCRNETGCLYNEDCYSSVCLDAQGVCPHIDIRTSFENVCKVADFAFSKFRRAIRFSHQSSSNKDLTKILEGMSAYEAAIPMFASLGRLLQEEVELFKQLNERISEFEQNIQVEGNI